MPRNRLIKTSFFEDAKLGREDNQALSLFFIGTWVMADDGGNLPDDAAYLRSYIYPFSRTITVVDAETFIQRLIQLGCMVRYDDRGEPALHIVNFTKHQTLRKPTYRHRRPTKAEVEDAVKHQCGTSAAPVRNQCGTDVDTDVAQNGREGKGTEGKKDPNGSLSGKPDDVRTVFEHWQVVWGHPGTKLDQKRRARIKAALKLRTVEELCKAIDGCHVTPHNLGINKDGQVYDAINVIFKDDDQIIRFMRNADNPPKPRTPANPRTANTYHGGDDWSEYDDKA